MSLSSYLLVLENRNDLVLSNLYLSLFHIKLCILNFVRLLSNLDSIRIPKNIHEALELLEWRETVIEEIRAFEKKGTWDVTELSKEKTSTWCK